MFAVAGQPSPLNSAREVNRVLKASDFYHSQVALGGAVKSKAGKLDADFVEIKNVSGGNLPRGSVVQLGDFILADKVQQHLRFEADTPTDNRRFVVLLDPLPAGATGAAVASGVCMALVTMADTDHEFATPVEDETHFVSAVTGPMELLSTPDGTGQQEMIVRFFPTPRGFDRIKGLLVGAMTSTDTTHTIDNITVTFGDDPRTDPTSSTEAITFTNEHEWSGDDNAICRLEWNKTYNSGVGRWEAYQVTCPE